MSKRRILQFCLLIFAILYTADTGAQWVKMNGVSENNIRDLEYLNGNYFAATHGSGIAKSTDNGLNWSATSLNYILGEALLVFNNNLVAGVQQNGVYYTTNNGTNWIQTNFENKWVHGLGKFSNTILLGNSIEYRIYSTTNYGTNWIFRLDRMAYCFETIGNTLFAGTTNGIYTSTNSGINFSPLNLQGYQVYTIKYKDDTTLFAGLKNNSAGYGAVYRSFNSGNFWHMTSLNNVTINSIVVNGNYTFAGTDNGVYISSNNGYSWRQKNDGLQKTRTNVLLVNDNYIFAGIFDGGIYRRNISEIIGIQNISTNIPSSFYLHQNYPNPFNPSTTVKFDVLELSFVRISIIDITGREVSLLVNEQLQPGSYQTEWNASNFASGIYFYTLTAGNYKETKRMMLLK